MHDAPLQRPAIRQGQSSNHCYYPVLFPSEDILLAAMKNLNSHDIFPKRYFYPPLNRLNYIAPELRVACPIAEDVARRVLCLPLYGDLTEQQVRFLSEILLESFHGGTSHAM